MDFFDKFTDSLPDSMGKEPRERSNVRRRSDDRQNREEVPSNEQDITEELEYVPDDEYDGREV